MSGAKEEKLVGYFGFGSLVNRHTLRTGYHSLLPACLNGWRRHWQTGNRMSVHDIALLSVHKDSKCEIKGMLIIDRLCNLPLVDERETGYSRVPVCPSRFVLSQSIELPAELYVYVANLKTDRPDNDILLQSYLDAVMQGFNAVYGVTGVQHFVDTTANFIRPMLTDRHQPLYPRNVSISSDEAFLFDTILAKAGVSFQSSLGSKKTV